MTSPARNAVRLLRALNRCRQTDDFRARPTAEMNLDQFDAAREYLRPVDDPLAQADVDRYLSKKRKRTSR